VAQPVQTGMPVRRAFSSRFWLTSGPGKAITGRCCFAVLLVGYTALRYIVGMQSVIETPSFLADAKDAGLTDSERIAIVDLIAADPTIGDEIVGSGGARMVRVGGRGKGKSGGYRVVSFYTGPDIPVFLLIVLGKGEKAYLSKAEVKTLRTILSQIAESYRGDKERRQ
jgi:hypothetical protein